MDELDIDEQLFYSYAVFLQIQKQYKSRWAVMMFKAHYGKYPTKQIKALAMPTEPSQAFLDWVDEQNKAEVLTLIERKESIKERKENLLNKIVFNID